MIFYYHVDNHLTCSFFCDYMIEENQHMKEEFHSQCKNPVEILENVFVFTVFLVLVVHVFKIFLPDL